MSVRPINFLPNGDIDCIYDELGHSGTIPAAEIKWTTNIDGTESHNFIVLNCPDGCGAASSWPVAGGADAVMGQQMFVNKVDHDGCACGQVAATDSSTLGESHVRLLVNRQDGPGRWALG